MELLKEDSTTSRAPEKWRERIAGLLDFLPVLYPGGDKWLTRRLTEVERGQAWCAVLDANGELAGVAIGVLKDDRRFKICTLFVRPEMRGQGGGSVLVSEMRRIALEVGATCSYVTVAHTLSDDLWRVLEPAGFQPDVTQLHRYGDGRHETVFSVQH